MPPRIRSRLTAAALLTATLGGAALAPAAQAETPCANVEIIIARGTAEYGGPGPSFSYGLDGFNDFGVAGQNSPNGVYTRVRKELQTPTGPAPRATPRTVVRYDLPYPASVDFPNSTTPGTNTLINHLNSEAARCNQKKFMLFGYSQGATVIGNALAAPNTILQPFNRFFHSTGNDVSAAVRANVVAVGFFGNPAFNAAETRAVHGALITDGSYADGTTTDNGGYNDGTFTDGRSGIFAAVSPRTRGALSGRYPGRVRDYCIYRDFSCQGGTETAEHLFYIGDVAAKRNLANFALKRYRLTVPTAIPSS